MNMTFNRTASLRKLRSLSAGFSLIELIGVLAIGLILATLILATTLKSVDVGVSKQESTTLQNFATALQNSVLRNRYIPGASDWYQVIAAELGVSTNAVLYNLRNPSSSRVFMIDPSLSIAGGSLPYTQGTAGATTKPANPRVMIVSSLKWNTSAASMIGSTSFSNLWTTNDISLPDDFKIQRINLGPWFVNLTLANNASTDNGQYRIDGQGPVVVTNNVGVSAYFIQSTVLDLLKGATSGGTTNARMILTRDASYFYVQNVWRDVVTLPPSLYGTYVNQTNGDAANISQMISAAAGAFISSPYNNHALSGATPVSVLNAMSNFMYSYTPWATSTNFPNASGPYYSAAKAAQTALATAMNNLANGITESGCTNPP